MNIWGVGFTSVWSTAANWSLNSVPGNSGTVVFNGTAIDVIGEDQSSVVLNRFLIHDAYTGSIGTSTVPMQINAATLIIDKSVGTFHLSGDFADVYIYDTPAGTNTLTGTFGTLHLRNSRGTVAISDSAGIDTFEIEPQQGRSTLVTIGDSVTARSGSGRIGSIRSTGTSKIDAQSGTDALDIHGPTEFILTGDGDNDNATISGGCGYRHNSSGKPADGILRISGPDNTLFTLQDNVNDTITIDELDLRGGVADLGNGSASAVVTAFTYRAGRFFTDEDVAVAI